ncbi:MAG TPA: hypothetical protein VND19_25115 [Acetobacteraceae bacterium]|nr:hypothetical protein [Acetobacteraceae bacterium]
MALVLERTEGQDFYIRDERYVVTKIISPKQFTVRRDRDGTTFDMVDGQSYELAPDATGSVGSRGQQTLARISIEAPRSVAVLRGELYRPKE